MKVTKITNLPIRDKRGGIYHIVRVDTDAGIHGLGEVGILNWSRTIANAVDHLGELVIGSDPWETERLWQGMFRSGYWPADKVYCCAMSAIDIALWDIKGKAAKVPTYKLLGGPVREKGVVSNLCMLARTPSSTGEGCGRPGTRGTVRPTNGPGRPPSSRGSAARLRECASILETRPKGAPGRDKPVPYGRASGTMVRVTCSPSRETATSTGSPIFTASRA